MKTEAIKVIFILLSSIFVWGCASHLSPVVVNQTPHETFKVSQPVKYDVYDSNKVQFATITLILPPPVLGEELHGKWRGELAASYHRPKSDFVLASDKLNFSTWHDLTCSKDYSEPSYADIDLNPDTPSDELDLFVPISGGKVTGNWVYGTDAGEVDHGTFVGPVHKEDNRLAPQSPLVFIGGEFRLPGLYLWTSGITIRDLIRASGGFTDFSPPVFYLIHSDGSHKRYQLKSGYEDTNNIPRIIPDVTLKPGDEVISPRF